MFIGLVKDSCVAIELGEILIGPGKIANPIDSADVIEGAYKNMVLLPVPQNKSSKKWYDVFQNDLNQVLQSMASIKNDQDTTVIQLTKITKLIEDLEEKSILGALLKKNGIHITPDNIMSVLNTVKSGFESVVGVRQNSVLRIKNGGKITRRILKSKRKQRSKNKYKLKKNKLTKKKKKTKK